MSVPIVFLRPMRTAESRSLFKLKKNQSKMDLFQIEKPIYQMKTTGKRQHSVIFFLLFIKFLLKILFETTVSFRMSFIRPGLSSSRPGVNPAAKKRQLKNAEEKS